MINSRPLIDVKGYRDPSYYVSSSPITGTNTFGGQTDIKFKKKEEARPHHMVLVTAAIVAGIFYLGYKIDERF